MAKDYSQAARRQMTAVERTDPPLFLLEITHSGLSDPLRVVNDNAPLTHRGDEFLAFPFRLIPPSDLQQGQPRGQLEIDNTGRQLMQWIETSDGARGAQCRLIQVLRSTPDIIEWDVTLSMRDLSVDSRVVRASLSFDDILHLSAVALRHTPEHTPGIF